MAQMIHTPWAKDILNEGADILDKLGVKWWIEAGTLLGIYREGKLLDHDDPDLDVTVQEPADHEKLEKAFLKAGFDFYCLPSRHQLAMVKNEVIFDINFYEQQDNDLVMTIYGAGKIVQDYSLFDKLGKIKFNGRVFPTPQPIETYLEKRYHDWKTPKKKKRSFMHPGETKNWFKDE